MVVDTSAAIAILNREAEAARFTATLLGHDCVMSAASYLELVIVTVGRGIAARGDADLLLSGSGVELIPVSVSQARLAADAFIRFGKGRHPAALNYGDCFAYALAKERGEPLLFKGDDFARTDVEVAA